MHVSGQKEENSGSHFFPVLVGGVKVPEVGVSSLLSLFFFFGVSVYLLLDVTAGAEVYIPHTCRGTCSFVFEWNGAGYVLGSAGMVEALPAFPSLSSCCLLPFPFPPLIPTPICFFHASPFLSPCSLLSSPLHLCLLPPSLPSFLPCSLWHTELRWHASLHCDWLPARRWVSQAAQRQGSWSRRPTMHHSTPHTLLLLHPTIPSSFPSTASHIQPQPSSLSLPPCFSSSSHTQSIAGQFMVSCEKPIIPNFGQITQNSNTLHSMSVVCPGKTRSSRTLH